MSYAVDHCIQVAQEVTAEEVYRFTFDFRGKEEHGSMGQEDARTAGDGAEGKGERKSVHQQHHIHLNGPQYAWC